MSIRSKIEKKIAAKEQEIQELEIKIKEAKGFIEGMQESLKHLPKDMSDNDTSSSIRAGSRVAKTLNVLKKAGKPMHVADILKALSEKPTKEARASLSGSLGAYVRNRDIFNRPAPNTFGLIEWENQNSQDDDLFVKETDEVPEDFGLAEAHDYQ